MSRFTGPLTITEVQPGRLWRLVEPIRYEAGREGSGIVIEVPAGFETDGATIPRLLRSVMAIWGSYGRAAAMHDHLYWIIRSGQRDEYGRIMRPFGVRVWPEDARRAADAEFYRAMLACGTQRWLALLIWAAVRIGGARHCRGA